MEPRYLWVNIGKKIIKILNRNHRHKIHRKDSNKYQIYLKYTKKYTKIKKMVTQIKLSDIKKRKCNKWNLKIKS